jgi:hypothetical protein
MDRPYVHDDDMAAWNERLETLAREFEQALATDPQVPVQQVHLYYDSFQSEAQN